ncbi:FG-GAP repeat domain-containing protein, partial [Mongoliitalea lutea]
MGIVVMITLSFFHEVKGQGFIGDVFDCVLEPDFVDIGDFSITRAGTTSSLGANGRVVSFATPLVADIDGDGQPEIIILGYDPSEGTSWLTRRPRYTNNIKIFRFVGGSFQWVRTIDTPRIPYDALTPMAVVNIAPEGSPDQIALIVATSHTDPDVSNRNRLIAYNPNTGAPIWISDATYGNNVQPGVDVGVPTADRFSSGAAVGVADFNNDGIPEVYIYNEIFNARTGVKLADGGNHGQGINAIFQDGGAYGLSVAADIIPGDNLELAAGRTVYSVNIAPGANSFSMAAMTPNNLAADIFGVPAFDGFTSIADINGDGRLDVIVTTAVRETAGAVKRRYIYVWNPWDGLIGYRQLAFAGDSDGNEIRTGVAFVGDLQGSGQASIGVVSPLNLQMLRYQAGISNAFGQNLNLIWTEPTNDRSGFTTITMFDFDQDGVQELVYRDERNLRILNGNGDDLPGISGNNVYSMTGGEGPVIADVTGDGQADILITNVDEFPPNAVAETQLAHLEIWKAPVGGLPWAPARNIWNQYAYFAFNINDDLRVPRPQLNHARDAQETFPQFDPARGCVNAGTRVFNNFLVQTTFFNEAGCRTTGIPIMDAEIEVDMARFTCYDPAQPQIEVTVTIRNVGDLNGVDNFIPESTLVSFFVGNTPVAQTTVGDILGTNVLAGQTFTQTITINSSIADNGNSGSLNLTAIINAGFDKVLILDECNDDNESIRPIISRPQFSVAAPSPVCFQDDSGTLNSFVLSPVNILEGLSVNSSQLRWYIDNISGTQITNGTIGGVNYFINSDFSLEITGLPASATPYRFVLLDGCTGRQVPVLLTVNFIPAPMFTTEPVRCNGESNGRILVSNDQASYRYIINGTTYTRASLEATGFPAGDYTIEVRNITTNCVDFFPVSIIEPAQLVIENPQQNNPVCVPNNGSISWTAAGGNSTQPYVFSLQRNGVNLGVINPQQVSGRWVVDNIEGGEYVVTVTDFKGCSASIPFSVPVQQNPVYDANNSVICFGQEAVLEGVQAFEGVPAASPVYQWGRVDGSGVFQPFTDGQSIDGGQVILSNGGRTMRLVNLPVSATPYTYHLQVTGTNTCDPSLISRTVQVNPNPDVVVDQIDDVVCFGESNGRIVISRGPNAGSDSYNYQLVELSRPFDNGAFNNLPAGTYSVVVSNAATGCTTLLQDIVVDQPPLLTTNNQQFIDPTCGDPNGFFRIEFGGGVPNYILRLIQDGTTIQEVTDFAGNTFERSDLTPGSFRFEVEDQNGCITFYDFSLVNNTKVPIDIDIDDLSFCEGLPVLLTPVIDTQGFPRTVVWYKDEAKNQPVMAGPDPNDADIIYTLNGENLEIVGLKSGVTRSFFIDVVGTDYCPIDPVEVQVSITDPLDLAIDFVQEVCFGDGVTVTVDASGGNQDFEYSLDGNPFQTSNVFLNVPVGVHTVIVRTTQGCLIQRDFTVTGPPAPITINDDVIIVSSSCGLANGSISNIQAIGGYGNFTSVWNVGSLTGPEVGVDVFELEDIAPGTYFLTITDQGGCDFTASFVLQELPRPEVVIAPQEECIGSVIEFNPIQIISGAAATDLVWYKDALANVPIVNGDDPDDSNITYAIDGDGNLVVTGLPAGDFTYYLLVTCTDEIVEANARINPLPNPDFEVTDILCFGEVTGKIRVAANANPNYRYVVNGGLSLTQAELEALDLPAGTYQLAITNQLTGCLASQTLEIEEPPLLVFQNTGKTDPTCGDFNGTIRFSIAGGVAPYSIILNNLPLADYSFNEDQGSYVVTSLAPGFYSLEISDANGCPLDFPNEYELINNDGEVLVIDPMSDVICQGDTSTLLPSITTAVPPIKRWYLNA